MPYSFHGRAVTEISAKRAKAMKLLVAQSLTRLVFVWTASLGLNRI
jgi:hypothetical protein